jgi:hypothetical protein
LSTSGFALCVSCHRVGDFFLGFYFGDRLALLIFGLLPFFVLCVERITMASFVAAEENLLQYDAFQPPPPPDDPREARGATLAFWRAVQAKALTLGWVLDKTAAELNKEGKAITMSSLAGSLWEVDRTANREVKKIIHRGVLHVSDKTLPAFFRLVNEHPQAVLYLSIFCTPKHPIYIDVDLSPEGDLMNLQMALNIARRSGILTLPGFDDCEAAKCLGLPQLKAALLANTSCARVWDARRQYNTQRAEARRVADAMLSRPLDSEASQPVLPVDDQYSVMAAKRAKPMAALSSATESMITDDDWREYMRMHDHDPVSPPLTADSDDDQVPWLALVAAFLDDKNIFIQGLADVEDFDTEIIANTNHHATVATEGGPRMDATVSLSQTSVDGSTGGGRAGDAASSAAQRLLQHTEPPQGIVADGSGGATTNDGGAGGHHSRRGASSSSSSRRASEGDTVPVAMLLAARRLVMLGMANVLQRAVRSIFPAVPDEDLRVCVLGNYGQEGEMKRRKALPPKEELGSSSNAETESKKKMATQYYAHCWGGHLYMRGVTVDREVHMAVYERMCQLLGGLLTDPRRDARHGTQCRGSKVQGVDLHLYWRAVLDAAPFLGDTGALRPPWSCKARPCAKKQECVRFGAKTCSICHNKGVVHVPRMYGPVGVVDFVKGQSVMANARVVRNFFSPTKRDMVITLCNPRTLYPQTPGAQMDGICPRPAWGVRYQGKVEEALQRNEADAATYRHLRRIADRTPAKNLFTMYQTVIDDAQAHADLTGSIPLPEEDPRFAAVRAFLPAFCADHFHECYRTMEVRGVTVVYRVGEPILLRVTVRGEGSARCYNRRTDVDASPAVQRDLAAQKNYERQAATHGDLTSRAKARLSVPGEHNNWTACVGFELVRLSHSVAEAPDATYHVLAVRQVCRNATLHPLRRRAAFTDQLGETCLKICRGEQGYIEQRILCAPHTRTGLQEKRAEVRRMFYTPAEIERAPEVYRARIYALFDLLRKEFASKVPVVGPYDAYATDMAWVVGIDGSKQVRRDKKSMTPEHKAVIKAMRDYYGLHGLSTYDRYTEIFQGSGEQGGGDAAAVAAVSAGLPIPF